MATTMETKSRGILFSGEMVRAILDGRKTQTRRAVKHQGRPLGDFAFYEVDGNTIRTEQGREKKCRYGEAGDLLHVQEAAVLFGHERTGRNGQYLWPKFASDADGRRWFDNHCQYAADLKHNDPLWIEPHGTLNKMFMPRWASRITLRITEVRVERLHEISEADARAEGWPGEEAKQHPYGWYRDLWNQINGKGSWTANPWVWVVSFEKV